MARIRTIKPEFPQSESMGRVSRDARLLFVMLWPICDDHGRTRAASRMLASLLFPYDDDAPGLIGGWLDELEREGCISRYESNGSTFLVICNWLTHQKIDKPSKAQFPDPPGTFSNTREVSSLEGMGKEGSGLEQGAPLIEPAAPAKPSPSKGSRIPADWRPSPDEIQWAKAERPDIDLKTEIESFRDHWTSKPGKDGVKTDWPTTFRNWIRRAYAPRGHAIAETTTGVSVAASRAL